MPSAIKKLERERRRIRTAVMELAEANDDIKWEKLQLAKARRRARGKASMIRVKFFLRFGKSGGY